MNNLFENLDTTSNGVFRETSNTRYTNEHNIPEYLASRLVDISEDSYGGEPTPNLISATTLGQPIKEIIHKLNRVDNPYKVTTDVNSLIKSVNGTILHDAYFGPKGEPKRQFKQILGYTISGGADRITYGPNDTSVGETDDLSILVGQSNIKLRDIKTTSTHVVRKIKFELAACPDTISLSDMRIKFPSLYSKILQQSIYNWLYDLNVSVGYLDFIIMNHSPMDMSTVGPQMQGYEIPLASIEDTIAHVTDRVEKVIKYRASGFMPDCTQQELIGKPTIEYKLVKSTDMHKPNPRAANGSGGAHPTMALALAKQQSEPKLANCSIVESTKPSKNQPACLGFCEFGRAMDSNNQPICKQGWDIVQQQG